MPMMENLLHLYRVDSQARGLQSRVRAAERYLAAQQKKLDEVVSERHERETRRRHLQAELHNTETEIAGLTERIEKHRAELNTARTNKEFTALLSEVNTLKAKKNDLETTVIDLMERVEALTSERSELDAAIAERSKHRDIAQSQLEERRADVGERLSELEAEREEAASQIPAGDLAAFNELADQYEGEALAAIEIVDRRNREYACGTCNMHVPFEAVLALMSAGDTLVRCTACRRILYLQEETRGALTTKK